MDENMLKYNIKEIFLIAYKQGRKDEKEGTYICPRTQADFYIKNHFNKDNRLSCTRGEIQENNSYDPDSDN